MMSQVEVKGIGICLDGKDVLLSLKDARELCRKLNELFGKLPDFWTQPMPSQPIIIEKRFWPYWQPYNEFGPGRTAPHRQYGPGVWCSTEAP